MTTGNNLEKDFLAETLKSRLENQTMPVDENCWAEIEQRMQNKRRIIPFWLWSAIGGAAAVAVLLITLLPFTNNQQADNLAFEMKKQTELSSEKTVQSEKLTEKPTKNLSENDLEVKNQARAIITVSEKKSFESNALKTKILKKNNAELISENNSTGKNEYIENKENVVATTSEKENITENKQQNITDRNSDKKEQEKETTEEKKSDVKKQSELTTPETKKYERPKRKSERPLLAAAFGSVGGLNLSSSGSLDAAPSYENLADLKTTYARIMAPNEFSSITDIAPLSFGLKVSKEFSPGWSVESGLIYTYMATLYEQSSWGDIKADMNLHYLGIPVNLKHIVSKQNKWNIYLSGGIMAEKGLRSIYNQYTISGNYTYKTVAKTKIDGVQWSMSGATGFSYDIFRDISTYFEPSITWYFDNNQPRSARTQQPLVVGFNAGLRFKL